MLNSKPLNNQHPVLINRVPIPDAFTRLYFLIWLMLVIGFIGFVLYQDYSQAKTRFVQLNNTIFNYVSDRVLVAETALEGFSAFVSSMETFDYKIAAEYGNTLLKRYPYLYMFEVADRIRHEQRELFEQSLASIYPGFYIRKFDFVAMRQWQVAPAAEFYYPIIFQIPYYEDKRKVVGLDLNSSDLLVEAMMTSYEQGAPIATRPFDLAEDSRGYVIYRSIDSIGSKPPEPLTADRYALLVLQSEQLFPGLRKTSSYLSISLRHGNYDQDSTDGDVISIPSKPVSVIEEWLFPIFVETQSLLDKSLSQPFILKTRWQLGSTDVSLDLITVILLTSASILLLTRKYASIYFRQKLKLMEYEGTLYHLANFDTLTGVPNRNRLTEHLESTILRAKRSRDRFSVLFIDVNHFKPINDAHGHAAGDAVLVEIANRLTQHLREDELLARVGGDEFVWVSNIALTKLELDRLSSRMKKEFNRPIRYEKLKFSIGLSIGSATYPDDGRNVSSLLEIADQRMYLDKQKCKNKMKPSIGH